VPVNMQSFDTESGLQRIWGYVKGRSSEIIRSVAIPPERVFDSGSIAQRFEPRMHYFAVVINEMFLADARQWWNEFDPMVFVVSEFAYDGKRTVVPFVVGPSLIRSNLQSVPKGMAITDTLVAGLHPYTGGKFALTVILAQVRRESYAKRVLQFVESVASAFPCGAALLPHLKVSGAVIDGVDTLFQTDGTKPIAGHRWEYNDGISPWLQPGFFALVDADERDLDIGQLSVVGGRLRDGSGKDAAAFRKSDYVLYSLRTVDKRNDLEELPFYRLLRNALTSASSTDEGSWERAKAGLVTLYQEMLTSPDLTWTQVQELAERFKEQLMQAHKAVESFTLGHEPLPASLGDTDFGNEQRLRLKMLREIHSVLSL
jgi:hypothetical protein